MGKYSFSGKSESSFLSDSMKSMEEKAKKHIFEDESPKSEFEDWTEEGFKLMRDLIEMFLPFIDPLGFLKSNNIDVKEANINGSEEKKYTITFKDEDLERIQKRTRIGSF